MMVLGASAPGLESRQPPKAEHPHPDRPHSEHLADALHDALKQAVPEKAELT